MNILLVWVFSALAIGATSAAVAGDPWSASLSERAPNLCPARGIATTKERYDKLVHYYTYAYAAYSDKCTKETFNSNGGIQPMYILGNIILGGFDIKSSGTQAFVVADDTRKELVVAFRGSEELKDFLTDANGVPVPLVVANLTVPNDVFVHKGFFDAHQSIYSRLLQFLMDKRTGSRSDYTIVTAGHSLGGALASLSGVILRNKMNVDVKIYTYGQPRTGNLGYVNWIERTVLATNIYRSVNRKDPVPHVLPQITGYLHHGSEYWTCGDGKIPSGTYECFSREQANCSRNIASLIPEFGSRPHRDYFDFELNQEFCSPNRR